MAGTPSLSALPQFLLNSGQVLQAAAPAPAVTIPTVRVIETQRALRLNNALQPEGLGAAQALPEVSDQQNKSALSSAISVAKDAEALGQEAFDGTRTASSARGPATPEDEPERYKIENLWRYYDPKKDAPVDAIRHARVRFLYEMVDASRGRPVTPEDFRKMMGRLSNELPQDEWGDWDLFPRGGYTARFLPLIKMMDNAQDLHLLFTALPSDPIDILAATEALFAAQREKATLSRSDLYGLLHLIQDKTFDYFDHHLECFMPGASHILYGGSLDFVLAHHLGQQEFERKAQTRYGKGDYRSFGLNRALFELFRSDIIHLLSRHKDVLKNVGMGLADYRLLANRMGMSGLILYLKVKFGFARSSVPLVLSDKIEPPFQKNGTVSRCSGGACKQEPRSDNFSPH